MLSPVVKQFIVEHIRSVEELEILLLLHAQRDRSWTGEEIARELRLDPKASAERLIDLKDRGFVVPGPLVPSAMIYAPTHADTESIFQALHLLYPRFRNAIIHLIVSSPNERLQSSGPYPQPTDAPKR